MPRIAKKLVASTEQKPPEWGDWVGVAWRAWIQGERDYAAIARKVSKTPKTVKSNLQAYAKARADALEDVDATAEYIEGLYSDLRECLRTYRETSNHNCKVGALKLASSIRQFIAAARGVVTERRSTELTGVNSLPVEINIVGFEEEE